MLIEERWLFSNLLSRSFVANASAIQSPVRRVRSQTIRVPLRSERFRSSRADVSASCSDLVASFPSAENYFPHRRVSFKIFWYGIPRALQKLQMGLYADEAKLCARRFEVWTTASRSFRKQTTLKWRAVRKTVPPSSLILFRSECQELSIRCEHREAFPRPTILASTQTIWRRRGFEGYPMKFAVDNLLPGLKL